MDLRTFVILVSSVTVRLVQIEIDAFPLCCIQIVPAGLRTG